MDACAQYPTVTNARTFLYLRKESCHWFMIYLAQVSCIFGRYRIFTMTKMCYRGYNTVARK
jgi:hypothetical protein